MQIVENKDLIPGIMGNETQQVVDSCNRWREWHGNRMNHWDFNHPSHFQDDSGV